MEKVNDLCHTRTMLQPAPGVLEEVELEDGTSQGRQANGQGHEVGRDTVSASSRGKQGGPSNGLR
jgi:hypothetical protein